MSVPPLVARGLAVSIGGQTVVRDFDLALQAGECLAILGRNGAGKTTLLHTLAGLRPADAGQVELAGETYARLGPHRAARGRGLLLQHQGDAFPASVLETVLVGRHPHLSRFAWEGAEDGRIARAALAAVGMSEFAEREVHTLSGGERQRVAIAALLAQRPQVYLLDEPLAHLDLNHQIAILGLFNKLARQEGAAVAVVLHDVNLAARFCDQALLLFGDGRYSVSGIAEQLDEARLGELYGHPMRAVPDGARRWFMPA